MNPDGLSDDYRAKLFGVFEKYPEIAFAYVYGSRATGRYRKDSDLDLVLESPSGQPIDRGILTKIWLDIEDLYLAIDVELHDRAEISSPTFAANIARDQKLWWTRALPADE